MDGVKTPVIIRPDYVVYIEQQQVPFLHSDVYRWTPRIQREYKRDLDLLFALHGGPWYVWNAPDGAEKRAKFLRFCGFEFFKAVEGFEFFRRV